MFFNQFLWKMSLILNIFINYQSNNNNNYNDNNLDENNYVNNLNIFKTDYSILEIRNKLWFKKKKVELD